MLAKRTPRNRSADPDGAAGVRAAALEEAPAGPGPARRPCAQGHEHRVARPAAAAGHGAGRPGGRMRCVWCSASRPAASTPCTACRCPPRPMCPQAPEVGQRLCRAPGAADEPFLFQQRPPCAALMFAAGARRAVFAGAGLAGRCRAGPRHAVLAADPRDHRPPAPRCRWSLARARAATAIRSRSRRCCSSPRSRSCPRCCCS